jgi:hypothetical protein
MFGAARLDERRRRRIVLQCPDRDGRVGAERFLRGACERRRQRRGRVVSVDEHEDDEGEHGVRRERPALAWFARGRGT